MFTNDRGVSTVPDLDQALNDRLQLSQAIRDINRYALARIDHRTNSIQMHRLVQAVLISQMRPDEQADMRHAAHLLLAANPPLAPDDDDQWARYGQLYPHVIATRYLYHRGDHGASRDMAQRVYDIWSARLGTDDPDTLRFSCGDRLVTLGDSFKEPTVSLFNAIAHPLLLLFRLGEMRAEERGQLTGAGDARRGAQLCQRLLLDRMCIG